jgi:hypothetical protein
VFVLIARIQKRVPSDLEITKAMASVGGVVHDISGTDERKRVDFTGVVNHNRFAAALATEAHGKPGSWDLTWGDAPAHPAEPVEASAS